MARWYAMSTRFLSDPKVERMVDRHGNDAVTVSLALLSQAMVQENGGKVERTYRTLANESFTDKETAEAIVKTAAEVGLLVLDDSNDYEFVVHFPAWERHQANFRKAKSRASKATSQADVTGSHDPVTPGHKKSLTVHKQYIDKTGQEKTGEGPTTVAKVIASLEKVAFARSETSPSVEKTTGLCEQFASLDLPAQAEKFAHYWTGPAAKRDLPGRDALWAFRSWLESDNGKAPKVTKAPTDRSIYDAKVEAAS